MSDPLTMEGMSRAIGEVHAALPKFGLSAEAMPVVVRLYRDALRDYDQQTVDGAVKLLLRESEKFPTPKVWREACRVWLKHYRIRPEWSGELDDQGNDIVCRRCRSVARWAYLEFQRTPFTRGAEDRQRVLRRIAPCNPERHSVGDMIVEKPVNFIAWAE